jgi:transcriptional regulator with XRE-family HTH domain
MFSERLKSLIEKKGIDQKKFGEYFNLSKQAISGYVTNKRTPNIELLKQFAVFFDCTIDYLLGKTDDPDYKIIDKEELPKELILAGIEGIEVFKDLTAKDLTDEDYKDILEAFAKIRERHK